MGNQPIGHSLEQPKRETLPQAQGNLLDLTFKLSLGRGEAHFLQGGSGHEVLTDGEGDLELIAKENCAAYHLKDRPSIKRHAVLVVAEAAALLRNASSPSTGDFDAVAQSVAYDFRAEHREPANAAAGTLQRWVAEDGGFVQLLRSASQQSTNLLSGSVYQLAAGLHEIEVAFAHLDRECLAQQIRPKGLRYRKRKVVPVRKRPHHHDRLLSLHLTCLGRGGDHQFS